MKRPKIFYGWFVVAACFLVMLTFGETFWAFGVFFKPLENEFGWSRTLVSSGYTAFLAGYAVSVILSGRLADRYNPQPILLASALLAGLGISLCSRIHTVSQLCLFFFVAGLGSGATWSIPSASVQRWFYGKPKAGLALSITTTGAGVGALICAPLLNYLIINHGWRTTFLVTGIVSFAVTAISSLVVKPSPTDAETALLGEKSRAKSATTQGRSINRPATSPAFICLVLVGCAGAVAFQVVSVHLVPLATDAGISSTAAAAALGLMGGFSVPGRLLSGFIADRIGWQRGLALSLFGVALSILWLLFLQATWMLYCFAFCFGVFHGYRIVAQAGIVGEFFGMRSVGELIGISSAASNAVGAIAPYIAGFIFDTTGSYFSAFVITLVILSAGGIIATIMKNPSITGRQPPVKLTAV